jgi:hypothetical protein
MFELEENNFSYKDGNVRRGKYLRHLNCVCTFVRRGKYLREFRHSTCTFEFVISMTIDGTLTHAGPALSAGSETASRTSSTLYYFNYCQ